MGQKIGSSSNQFVTMTTTFLVLTHLSLIRYWHFNLPFFLSKKKKKKKSGSSGWAHSIIWEFQAVLGFNELIYLRLNSLITKSPRFRGVHGMDWLNLKYFLIQSNHFRLRNPQSNSTYVCYKNQSNSICRSMGWIITLGQICHAQ